MVILGNHDCNNNNSHRTLYEITLPFVSGWRIRKEADFRNFCEFGDTAKNVSCKVPHKTQRVALSGRDRACVSVARTEDARLHGDLRYSGVLFWETTGKLVGNSRATELQVKVKHIFDGNCCSSRKQEDLRWDQFQFVTPRLKHLSSHAKKKKSS